MTTPPSDTLQGPSAPVASDDATTTEEILLPDIPPLTFDVPESFHALPIAITPEHRAALAEEFVRDLYPNGDDDLWTPAAPYYAALGETMGDQGLAYAAMGLFSIPEGIAHCSFTVAAIESDHPSVDVAANGIREILVRDENNDARWIDLPCGPAVSCVTLRQITISPELTASGEEARLHMGQVQVYVPFSTGPYTAVFTMDTAAVDYWGEFSEMMMAVLRTISFADSDDDAGAAPGAVAGSSTTAEETPERAETTETAG
ncbi:hypothetical protein [Actinacidiphila rubida]|uniref:Uncharacterized protein n=1 Tax=Actinacidiphila rubida TaxID=310780 RepID=A0A1H8DLV1_9ACTN|nr:hypothetical protein [Actinacidiphila rubida]SEN07518.1 hypothetical protein SAMN05216267_1001150 [Actinacidiphila rubida]